MKNCLLAIVACILLHSLSHAAELRVLPEVGDVVLKPTMRPDPTYASKYSIKTDDMRPYLENIMIFDDSDSYERLPRIIGFTRDCSIGGSGDSCFATGINIADNLTAYTILNRGSTLVDPDTEEELGFEALVVGNALLQESGDPQLLYITDSEKSIDNGARLIPHIGLDLPPEIVARFPEKALLGYILSVQMKDSGVGRHNVAIIGLGQRDGLQQGDLLNVLDPVHEIVDPSTGQKAITSPKKYADILIYKTLEKVSLGFILDASHPVTINSRVVSATQGS